MVIIFTVYGLIPKINENYVSAAPLKTAYKVGDAFMDATTKSLQARKGIYIENIEWVGKPPPPKETFTKSIQKNLQDVAMDAYNTINGSRLDATPLKNNPKWLKVFVGTTAFLSGADLVLDIYDLVNSGQELEFVTTNPDVGNYALFNDVYITKDASFFYFHSSDLGAKYLVGSTEYIITDTSTSFYKTRAYDQGYVKWVGGNIEFGWYYNYSWYSYLIKKIANGSTTSANVGIQTIKPNHITKYDTPEIDTTKEKQVLLVPNPEVVPIEEFDQLIQENKEMVENPDKWLQENPDADPDYNPDTNPDPNPDPNPQPQPDSVTNKSLKDTITEFFVPSVPMGDLWTPIGDTVKTKFNEPKDFEFLVPAFTEGSCPPNIKLNGMKIGSNNLVGDVVDLSIPCGQAPWWKAIATGLIYFLFGWWLFRKANALMSKHGGTE